MFSKLYEYWFFWKVNRKPFNPEDYENVKKRSIRYGSLDNCNLPYYLTNKKTFILNIHKTK